MLAGALFGACTARERPVAVRPAPPPASALVAPERWIHVDKTRRQLTLYEGRRVLKTYPIVLGGDPLWAKLYEGDQRTPEGEYHVSKKYFHPFWQRFMLLDYPTATNREVYAWSRDRGLLPVRGGHVPPIGGAIGIHGTKDDRLNRDGIDWTHGCISLFSDDVEELYELVPLGTRVEIER